MVQEVDQTDASTDSHADTEGQAPAVVPVILESLTILVIAGAILSATWILRPRPVSPSAIPLPTLTFTATSTSTATPTATSTATATATPTPPPASITYTVQPGDGLLLIAIKFGTTVEAIMAANGITDPEELIMVGHELIIPLEPEALGLTAPRPTDTPLPILGVGGITHTVRSGDTLIEIAQQYETSVEAVMAANDMTDPEQLIRAGDVLIISWGTPTVTPTPTATLTPTWTPRPTRTPTATVLRPSSTPSLPYPAPFLLGPVDGETFAGAETVILLNWASVGILAPDEWYVVRVRYPSGGQLLEVQEWLKATSWRLPKPLYGAASGTSAFYQWDVIVMRESGIGRDGVRQGQAISLPSERRTFTWQ